MGEPDTAAPPVKTLNYRVRTAEHLNPDVLRLFLSPADDRRLQHRAGQYVDVLLPGGIRRSFSIANAPGGGDIELHIRRVRGGEFSDFIFNHLQRGDTLQVRGPYGDFFLREHSRRPVILLAGGTGFAPIKGIIEHAFNAGFDRDIHLYWGARTRHDLYLHQLARSWSARPRFAYIPVLSDTGPDSGWRGRSGPVHQTVIEDFPDMGGYEVYANGPRPLITSAREVFVRHGLPQEYFYYDAP